MQSWIKSDKVKPLDGAELEDLIKKADSAMYAAKKAGRNKVVKYTPDIELVGEKNTPRA